MDQRVEVQYQLLSEQFGDLTARDVRLKVRAAEQREQRLDQELRIAARDAVIRLEESEAQQAPATPPANSTSATNPFIAAELQEVAATVPPPELRLCTQQGVYVHLAASSHRAFLVKLHFTDRYPDQPLAIDLESPTIHADLLTKLRTAAEQSCKQAAGQAQVLPTLLFLRQWLQAHRLLPAYQEIQQLQALFKDGASRVLKMKDKTGCLQVQLKEGQYELLLQLQLPEQYPQAALQVELVQSNLPPDIVSASLITAINMAQRCAEPPQLLRAAAVGREGAGTGGKRGKGQQQSLQSAKQEARLVEQAAETAAARAAALRAAQEAFSSQLSLLEVVRYLQVNCLMPLAGGRCPCCEKRLLPGDPCKLGKVPRKLRTLRLDCCHLYHAACIEQYLAQPPFDKGCCVCGRPVCHYQLVSDPRVLEARWASQQARIREAEDVAAFMVL